MTPEQVRAEVRAHAELIERQLAAECERRHERTNSRVSELGERLDRAGLTTTEVRERVARLETTMTTMIETVTEVRDEQREARAQARRTQWWVITTLAGVVLTLALRLAGL